MVSEMRYKPMPTSVDCKLDKCEYSEEVRQEMTRDKFVFGLADGRVKEKLLHEEKPGLPTFVDK